MKHTPGPWTMSEPYRGEAGGKCVSITGVHSHYYEGVDYNSDLQKADARLIAAAPDLFNACSAVVASFLKTPDNQIDFDAIRSCIQALAKAKGESDEHDH